MKITVCTIFCLLNISLAKCQIWRWAVDCDLSAPMRNECYVTTDGSGNIYVSGSNHISANLIKFDSQGNIIWRDTLPSYDGSRHCTDFTGNTYIVGYPYGKLSKIDSAGSLVWQLPENFFGDRIQSDNLGNLVVTGFLLYGDTLGNCSLSGDSVFMAKFDTSGNCIWFIRRGWSRTFESLWIDENDNIFVSGKYETDSVLLPGSVPGHWVSYLFISKYNSSGSLIWQRFFGRNDGTTQGNWSETRHAITTDSTGDIYITGSFNDTLDMGSFRLVSPRSNPLYPNTNNEIYIARLDSLGNVIWAKSAGALSDDEGRCIQLLPDGTFVVGGSYVGHPQFDNITLSNWGNYDGFIARYDKNGNLISVINEGGPTWNEKIQSFALSPTGDLYAVSEFSDSVIVGDDTLYRSNPYSKNVFLAKIDWQTVSIEGKLTLDFQLYPNPASEKVIIRFQSITSGKFFLCDLFGTAKLIEKFSGAQAEISLDDLNSGIYLLKIETESGAATRKLIIQK